MSATAPTTTHTVFRAGSLTCPSCVTTIEKQVGRLEGVTDVRVRFASGRVEVDHDPVVASTDDIVAAIARAGYRAAPSSL